MGVPRKCNPSAMPRFTGKTGRRNLLNAICAQRAVANDRSLARRLISSGSVHTLPANRTVVRQGGADNDIYMLVFGSVSIVINKREIAVRSAGTHVGEMALLDSTARRSATILTREETVVLQISEPKVTRVARDYPDFWRRLAIELASRLRERTRFIREPNSVPLVFIGSSRESLKEATHIEQALSRHRVTCKLWTQDVFQLSRTAIEDLVEASGECDFAVLFLTPDDLTVSRRRKRVSPRDNVVFELGLFMGAIGRNRAYIVIPKGADIKLPTDLLGVTHASYERGGARSLGRRFRQVSRVLMQRINELGPK